MKNGVKNIQAAAYNGARRVVLNDSTICWNWLSLKTFRSAYVIEKNFSLAATKIDPEYIHLFVNYFSPASENRMSDVCTLQKTDLLDIFCFADWKLVIAYYDVRHFLYEHDSWILTRPNTYLHISEIVCSKIHTLVNPEPYS